MFRCRSLMLAFPLMAALAGAAHAAPILAGPVATSFAGQVLCYVTNVASAPTEVAVEALDGHGRPLASATYNLLPFATVSTASSDSRVRLCRYDARGGHRRIRASAVVRGADGDVQAILEAR